MPQDVRRDQPEHSVPLETERATSSTARQEDSALTRRHDTAERAHHASDRRHEPQRGDGQEPGARMAGRRGLDVRPGEWRSRQLLRGMRLSHKKPGECMKELHSPEQQHANTHRLFIKLCWLMDKHAVSADRVVNIDEISCWCIRSDGATTASNKLSCRATRGRPRHSWSPSAWIVARWICWCRSCTRARQTPSCWRSPGQSTLTTSRQRTAGPPRPRSCSSRRL